MRQPPHLHFCLHCTSLHAAWTPVDLTPEPGSRMLSPWPSFWSCFLRLVEQSGAVCVSRREGGHLRRPKRQGLMAAEQGLALVPTRLRAGSYPFTR